MSSYLFLVRFPGAYLLVGTDASLVVWSIGSKSTSPRDLAVIRYHVHTEQHRHLDRLRLRSLGCAYP